MRLRSLAPAEVVVGAGGVGGQDAAQAGVLQDLHRLALRAGVEVADDDRRARRPATRRAGGRRSTRFSS